MMKGDYAFRFWQLRYSTAFFYEKVAKSVNRKMLDFSLPAKTKQRIEK